MENIDLSNTISFVDSNEFTVSVRNTDPLIRLNERKAVGRTRGILNSAASAAVIVASLSLFLLMSDETMMVPFTLVGAVVFMLYTGFKNKFSDSPKLVVTLILIIAFIATLVVFRKYIGGGLAILINETYDYAEEAQAYIYNRLPVTSKAEESPDLCKIIAVCWCSSLIGLLLAIPGERFRSLINTLIVVVTMMVFAYFGIVPSWIGAMAILAVFIISANKGRVISSWPIILTVLLVFGAIVLIDPGENVAVSRANENLRDRFAFQTAYIEGVENPEPETEEEKSTIAQDIKEFLNGDSETPSASRVALVVAIPVILIGAVVYLIHRRLSKKRKIIRRNIDSTDPNTAIGAMFPYTVRWLKPCGINIKDKHFSDLISGVRSAVDDEYADRYEKMFTLWKEAVYSDHALTDDNKAEMAAFMKDTIKLTKARASLKEKLMIRFRYAL